MKLEPSILFWGGVWILRERQKEQIQQQMSWSQLLVSTLLCSPFPFLSTRLTQYNPLILIPPFLQFPPSTHHQHQSRKQHNTRDAKSLHVALLPLFIVRSHAGTRCWNSLLPLHLSPRYGLMSWLWSLNLCAFSSNRNLRFC